jgi:hypothetical protein
MKIFRRQLAACCVRHIAVLVLCAAWAQPTFAVDAAAAALPRLITETADIANGTVIRLGPRDDFQAALDRAAPGDTIELEPGAVFRGPFTLPVKTGTQWITVRSAAGRAPLPPVGVRVTPADAGAMARLESARGAVLETAPGAHHYRFIGIEFGSAGVYLDALVVLGRTVKSVDAMPHHFEFERCYLHGDPAVGGHRGMVMNSASTVVRDSWLAGFKTRGEDSQAIVGWGGSGPYRVVNNYLEAAGENLMFGGADPLIDQLVPSDIEIRGNHFAKPRGWKAGESGYAGTNWTIKNLLELKNARRVLIAGNVFEYNWPQAQNGYAILFTVRNQQGRAPWSAVEDVTFSDNIVRHVGSGINMLGTDNNFPSGNTRRIHIRNNLFEDVGGAWGTGDLLQFLDGVNDVVVEHNTAFNTAKILMSDGRTHHNLVFRDNIVQHNQYGMTGSGTGAGNQTLDRYFRAVDLRGNVIIGGPAASYPEGNAFPRTVLEVGFDDLDHDNYRLSSTSPYRGAQQRADAGVDVPALCAALSPTEQPPFCRLADAPAKAAP